MKIWLLTSETPLYNPGGIARYVDNFARYLAAEGHNVTVFGRDERQQDCEIVAGYHYKSVVPRWEKCGEPGPTPRPDDHPSWPYNILDYWGAFSYQMAEAVLDEIESAGPPDVIESQEYCALPYYLLQRKLTGDSPLAGIPFVVNAHSPDFVIREFNEEPRYQLPHYWTGRLEKFCLHAADAVICPSGYLSRQLEDLFGNSIKVTHFPLPWTDPGTEPAQDIPESGKALYFGRLEVRKGTLDLVDACSRLWEKGSDFTLHLVGSDTRYFPRGCTVGDWIRRKHAKWIDSGQLTIRPPMPHEELMQEIRTAELTLVPSRWENWPNTCIEAMSLGKVVVGSVNGGQAEMIGDDGACGFLFSWDTEGSFEKVMTEAFSLTDGGRLSMGKEARRRIAGLCAPEVVLPRRLEHFKTVVETHSPATSFPFVNRRLRESKACGHLTGDASTKDRVSVVIPYYNMGRYLESTLESALEADWEDKEIIIIDDGSDDPESLEVLASVAMENHTGVKIHRQENSGLAAARNTGVEKASGRYILLLDADDQIEPTFVKKAAHVLQRYENVHIVYSWERYMEGSADIYPCWNFELPYLLGHNMTCPVSLLYRHSYLQYGPSKPEMAYNFEDFELWINLVKNGCGGVALVEPLSRYRVRENSMWQGSPREQHLFLQDRIAELHPDLYSEYGAELFCLLNANGSSQKWVKPSANSPFDEYEQWSRKRIVNLEKEAKRWWEHSVSVEKRLQESEEKGHAVWLEKNRLEKELLGLRARTDSPPS